MLLSTVSLFWMATMNLYDLIKKQYQNGETDLNDIERYVRERMITSKEADLITNLNLKEIDPRED